MDTDDDMEMMNALENEFIRQVLESPEFDALDKDQRTRMAYRLKCRWINYIEDAEQY